MIIFGGGDICDKGIIPVVGGTSIPHSECDVTDSWQIRRVLEEHHPETVIVTAGVSHPANIKDSDISNFLEEIETNLIGSYRLAKHSLEYGVKNLIFIASVAGLYGKPNHAAYSASKGGVISLVQSLGMEGHNVYAISPGRVDTKMRQKDHPNDTPGSRLEPEQIGHLIKDVLAGKYEPGDNLIIRKIGMETQPIKVDKGEPWLTELRVGKPVTI